MTDDDGILKALGARVREERAERDGTPEAIPAFDAAAEDRIVGLLLGQPASASAGTAEPGAPKAGADVVVLRPSGGAAGGARSRLAGARWLYAAAPLAAAAALVLFVATRGSKGAMTPPYDVSMVSASQMRDPSSARTNDGTFDVDPDGELELIARPGAPVKHAHARAFLVRSGSAQPWLVPLQVSEEGAVRIAGMTRVLFPTTSAPYDVVIFVSASDALPSDSDARQLAIGEATAAQDAEFRVIRATIRFVEKK